MNREDGVNSGYRNIGRFFLSAIPAILGIAASVWLGVWIEAHGYLKKLSQESRAAVYTGAQLRPTSKVKAEAPSRGCVKIVRVDIDGEDVIVYGENHCNKVISNSQWYWQLVSPDGTVIHEGYENYRCSTPSEPGDKAECRFEISDDDRATLLRVWETNN